MGFSMSLSKYALFIEAAQKKGDTRPQAKAGTKEREKINNLDDLLGGPKSKGSLAKPEPKVEPKSAGAAKLKAAGAEKTSFKAASATIDASKAPRFNPDEIDTSQETDDVEASHSVGHSTAGHKPKPVTPNTLPAVISKALTTIGKDVANIEPEWHMVKHLPGYMSKAIRALGRQVFSPFTNTKIEDIQVVAHVGGGPNTEAEVNAVSKYVSGHGTRDKTAELAFQKVLPDYKAQVVSYNCDGITFFMVKDFAGHYIYAWPQSDSKDVGGTAQAGIEHSRQARAELTHDRKLIGHDTDDLKDLMSKYGL